MESDHYLGWLALALTPGLGARMAGKLLREMGSPQQIFNASLTELESHHLPAAVAQAIHSHRPLSDAAKELAAAQAAGCKLLTWDEPEYPARLREIYDPPPLLYVLGNIELLNRHLISIVGSRRPTPYGNQMAERLGRNLAGGCSRRRRAVFWIFNHRATGHGVWPRSLRRSRQRYPAHQLRTKPADQTRSPS